MYLLWAIFNAALSIFFIALVLTFISKGRKMFQTKYSGLFIVVLTIGIISMLNTGTQKKHKNTYDFNAPKKQLNSSQVIKMNALLEDDVAFVLFLDVRLRKENQNLIPIYSRTGWDGFASGFEWEYQSAEVYKDDIDGVVRYTARGIMHWQLMNIHVYSEAKEYEGILRND